MKKKSFWQKSLEYDKEWLLRLFGQDHVAKREAEKFLEEEIRRRKELEKKQAANKTNDKD